jgi:hypothetical protein
MGDILDFNKKLNKNSNNYTIGTYGDVDTITVDGVTLDMSDISYAGTLLTSGITVSQAELEYYDNLFEKNEKMYDFIRSLLNPDMFGHSVTAEVRDEARYVLGMKKVETV